MTIYVSPSSVVLARELWEGTRGNQFTMDHVNMEKRGLFATKVLLGVTGRLLATQPEKIVRC